MSWEQILALIVALPVFSVSFLFITAGMALLFPPKDNE